MRFALAQRSEVEVEGRKKLGKSKVASLLTYPRPD